MGDTTACRSCRRPIERVPEIGWLHSELPQYAHEPITCEYPHPVECKHLLKMPCPLEASDGR